MDRRDTIMNPGFTRLAVGSDVRQHEDAEQYRAALGQAVHERDLRTAKEMIQ